MDILGEQILLPFGLSLKFNIGRNLHIFNIGIENFSRQSEIFEIRVGDSLTLLFSDEAVLKSKVLSLANIKLG